MNGKMLNRALIASAVCAMFSASDRLLARCCPCSRMGRIPRPRPWILAASDGLNSWWFSGWLSRYRPTNCAPVCATTSRGIEPGVE